MRAEEYDDNEELLLVEDHDNHESGPVHEDTEGVWLISYADMMTLLMGFFALMTSMADFDEEKFAAVGEQTAEYMGGKVEKPFEEIGKSIEEMVKEKQLQDQVSVNTKKAGIEISFTGTLLFDSGSINLKQDASSLMDEIAKIVTDKAQDKKVLIEGHTDDVPISRGIVASNWELSSLRANRVARLFENQGFLSEHILTLGLGSTRPLVPNSDEHGSAIAGNQSKNRRVVIKIMKSLPL